MPGDDSEGTRCRPQKLNSFGHNRKILVPKGQWNEFLPRAGAFRKNLNQRLVLVFKTVQILSSTIFCKERKADRPEWNPRAAQRLDSQRSSR